MLDVIVGVVILGRTANQPEMSDRICMKQCCCWDDHWSARDHGQL